MKKILVAIFFMLSLTSPLFASTVGSPDLSVPEESLVLKDKIVDKTLDRYEFNMNIKASVDMEFVTKRKLVAAPEDISNTEMEGFNFMVKLSNNFSDVFEPYVKLGTSVMEVKWDQHGNNVKVETDPGFAWGVGAKAKIWEFKDCGVKLTLDAQYLNTELTVDRAKIGGSSAEASAVDKDFKMKEWQASLLASKKFIVPFGVNDCYIIPYTGITYSSTDVDAKFIQSTTGLLYSTYNASDKNEIGLVLGCDVMPFFLSYYLLNFELRLINETAITLGGTVKF
jgi:hypothetical protein